MTLIDTPPVEVLRTRMRGALLAPGAPGWADATQAFNLIFEQRPALVAVPADEDDVVAVVQFAQAAGLQVAPQRTGHNAEPLGAMDGVILVRTDRLRGVTFDVERGIARIRSGSKWADVIERASALGFALPHGSTGDVSATGYSLGGGVGWYGRRHGLAADRVVAIELVTADGVLRRVDAETHPDLFWALRGGGGNFGIVTAIEVRMLPLAELYAGVLFFPIERAAEVLHAWLDWTDTVPDEVTSVGRVLRLPDMPELPADVRGREWAVVEAFVLTGEARGAELLAPLRALGPQIDTFAMVPPAAIAELHMDPQEPLPYEGTGQMLGSFDHAGVDAFVAAVGAGSGATLISAEIRHLGGAFARPAANPGALGTLDAAFLTFSVGVADDDATAAATHGDLERIARALDPYDNGRQYLNFTEEATDVARFYRPEAYARLREVKARWDRGRLFRANHPILPA